MGKRKQLIIFMLVLLMSIFPIIAAAAPNNPATATAAPNNPATKSKDPNSKPEIEAKSAILIEQNTGKILFQKNKDEHLFPASTTKILTALLAIENGDLKDIITVSSEINLITRDSTTAGLHVGEQISLENLIRGMLLPSGNDAANTIAVYIARKLNNDPKMPVQEALKKFSDLMNERAVRAGATSSHFANPHGYHDKNHYTTANDLALIAKAAMKYDFFREVVSTRTFIMDDWNVFDKKDPTKLQKRYWKNTNKLLDKNDKKHYYQYANGIKTGYTSAAGQCLVSSASKDGLNLIAVVLNSSKDGKWMDSMHLLDYGFNNFEYRNLAKQGQILKHINVKGHTSQDTGELDLVSNSDLYYTFKKSQIPEIEEKIEVQPNIKAPIHKGQILGNVTYLLNGTTIGTVDIVANRSIEKESAIIPSIPSPYISSSNGFSLPWWAWTILSIFVLCIIITIIRAAARARRRKRSYMFYRRR